MADNAFLGQGMKFPPQINAATGRFEVVSMEESVRQSIYMILMTQTSERPMRPGYGSNLMNHTFVELEPMMLNMIVREVKEQIINQEPRVADININVDLSRSRQGIVLFELGYIIRETNTRDNFVFPFYLNGEVPQEEGERQVYEPETLETDEY